MPTKEKESNKEKETTTTTTRKKEKKRTTNNTSNIYIYTRWKAVFEILHSIRARNYERIKPDQDWIDSLEKAAKNFPRGLKDIISEAEKFKIFLLSEFDIGKKQRDGPLRPRKAFFDWLRNAIKFRAGAKKKEVYYTPPRNCTEPTSAGDILDRIAKRND